MKKKKIKRAFLLCMAWSLIPAAVPCWLWWPPSPTFFKYSSVGIDLTTFVLAQSLLFWLFLTSCSGSSNSVEVSLVLGCLFSICSTVKISLLQWLKLPLRGTQCISPYLQLSLKLWTNISKWDMSPGHFNISTNNFGKIIFSTNMFFLLHVW